MSWLPNFVQKEVISHVVQVESWNLQKSVLDEPSMFNLGINYIYLSTFRLHNNQTE